MRFRRPSPAYRQAGSTEGNVGKSYIDRRAQREGGRSSILGVLAYGEVAERLKATVLKTVRVNSSRGFESLPLRQIKRTDIMSVLFITNWFLLLHWTRLFATLPDRGDTKTKKSSPNCRLNDSENKAIRIHACPVFCIIKSKWSNFCV